MSDGELRDKNSYRNSVKMTLLSMPSRSSVDRAPPRVREVMGSNLIRSISPTLVLHCIDSSSAICKRQKQVANDSSLIGNGVIHIITIRILRNCMLICLCIFNSL